MQQMYNKKTVPKNKYQNLSQKLIEAIQTGVYTHKMPSLRMLSEEYQVNIRTVIRAIDLLVEQGKVYRDGRRGTFVSKSGSKRVCTIGIVTSYITYGQLHSRLLGAVETAADNRNNSLLVSTHKNNLTKEKNILENLVRYNKVDGVILWTADPEKSRANVRILTKNNIPVVLVQPMDFTEDVNSVLDDDVQGAFVATRHLLEQGHRRIGFVVPSDWTESSPTRMRRWQGFIKAHDLAGIEPGPVFELPFAFKLEAFQLDGTLRTALKRTSALFCCTDFLAVNLMDALRSEGISIPHGVSIMGYDGFDESKQYNLTTMRQNIEKVGSTAVDLLLDIVEGRRQQPSHIIVEPELILRSTTGKEGD